MTSQVVFPKAVAPVVAAKKDNYNIYRTPSGQVTFSSDIYHDSFKLKSLAVLQIKLVLHVKWSSFLNCLSEFR